MNRTFDKFSRVSALRPARRKQAPRASAAADSLPAGAGLLASMLGAACERNRFGEHLVVRRWYAQPEPCPPLNGSLELLDPRAPRIAADPSRWLFLDTETTGLAGGTGTYAFLVGVAWWDGAGLQVEQFFLRDYADEHSMLLALAARLAERPVLVTFNGKSFDWPLLETRYRMTRSLRVPEPAAHLDLLHPARQVWRLRLGSVRLAELEREVLGAPSSIFDWDRRDDIPSMLIPQTYFDYLRGMPQATVTLAQVLRHNQMDLRGLAAIAVKMTTMLEAPETTEAEGLDLYGMARLVRHRRPQRAAGRSRRLCERALASGLPAGVDRAARRELAALAKRERDFARACTLWEQLADIADASPTASVRAPFAAPAVGADLRVRPRIAGVSPALMESAVGQTSRSVPVALSLTPRTSPLPPAPSLDTIEACVELAMHYEHRERNFARALDFARRALAALRPAKRAGLLSPEKHARLQIRLEKRIRRLKAKCGASLPLPVCSASAERLAATARGEAQKARAG